MCWHFFLYLTGWVENANYLEITGKSANTTLLYLIAKKAPEASLIIPDFTISVYSSSCNCLFFSLLCFLFVPKVPFQTQDKRSRNRSETKNKWE